MATEYILPNQDVSGVLSKFGAGSFHYDRLNSGIESDTPDDSNGVYGLDMDNVRLGFENPSFAGTSTAIIVRLRGECNSGSDIEATLYSDGSSSDGDHNWSYSSSWGNVEWSFVVAKTAAQLTSLQVKITCLGYQDDDWTSEVEVEITYTPPPAAVAISQINIGDVWKDVTEVKINVGDVWKDVNDGEINIGDVWKDMV